MKRLVHVCIAAMTAVACDDVSVEPESELATGAIVKSDEPTWLQTRICRTLEERLSHFAPDLYLLGVEGQRLHMGNAKLCRADMLAGWEVPSTGFLLGHPQVDPLACRDALAALPIAFDPDELPGAWGFALSDVMHDCSEPVDG